MGDFNGDSYDDKFVGALVTFVANDKFQTMFENFFLTYSPEFTNEEEHKLRYYEIYQLFHDMFEKQLELFCEDFGVSQSEFMRRCREATVRDTRAKHYIEILMSSVEYDTFVKLMRLMRPVAIAKLKNGRVNDDNDSKDSTHNSNSSPAKSTAKDSDDHHNRQAHHHDHDDDARAESKHRDDDNDNDIDRLRSSGDKSGSK